MKSTITCTIYNLSSAMQATFSHAQQHVLYSVIDLVNHCEDTDMWQ